MMSHPWAPHLHLHHLVLALGAEGPLIGQRVMVVGALVAVQTDGVARQLDDLVKVKVATIFKKNNVVVQCIEEQNRDERKYCRPG